MLRVMKVMSDKDHTALQADRSHTYSTVKVFSFLFFYPMPLLTV